MCHTFSHPIEYIQIRNNGVVSIKYHVEHLLVRRIEIYLAELQHQHVVPIGTQWDVIPKEINMFEITFYN